MKIKYLLPLAGGAAVLLIAALFLLNLHTKAASRGEEGTITVVAAPQECADCANKCKEWVDKCSEGGQYGCYKAAACLCQCNLDAGGCGSSKDALRQCVTDNEKAARDLGSPDSR